MASNKKGKSHAKGSNKSFADKRTMNPPQEAPQAEHGQQGDPKAFQQHDAEHHQGSFEGRGEHARTGNPGHS